MIAFMFLSILLQQPTQTGAVASRTENTKLREFLQSYVGNVSSEKDGRYLDASVDLNGDGVKEIIVYLIGGGWCGSGGCSTLILEPERDTYKITTEIAISNPPIRVLTTTSHGWHNLSVLVGGGGILQAYEAELPFDGTTYAENPTVPPARKLEKAGGAIVIGEDLRTAKPIFP